MNFFTIATVKKIFLCCCFHCLILKSVPFLLRSFSIVYSIKGLSVDNFRSMWCVYHEWKRGKKGVKTEKKLKFFHQLWYSVHLLLLVNELPFMSHIQHAQLLEIELFFLFTVCSALFLFIHFFLQSFLCCLIFSLLLCAMGVISASDIHSKGNNGSNKTLIS